MPVPDLHIVSFAVPYPATYGGAIDVYNRVKALHQEGLKIHLHCFVYSGFSPHNALMEITKEVHYYPRITWPALLSPGQPYIVASRRNPILLSRLSVDRAPVLFEGIHTTGYIDELKDRKRFLRAHNVEHQYYGQLAKDSQRFQYLFFQRESLALERYECNRVKDFDKVFAISSHDQDWFDKKGAESVFMPVFHGYKEIELKDGKGDFILYQGDLSIESNQKSVLELLQNFTTGFSYPIVIAGRSGDKSFEEKLTKYPNLRREADVSESKMHELIRDAQVIIVHSKHKAGMKVKIFPAMYNGRHVVANENSLTYTPLDKGIHSYSHVSELKPLIDRLWILDFNGQELETRKEALAAFPNDHEKAKELIRHI